MKVDQLAVEAVNNGELLAEVNLALQQVVENISDPDTAVKGKRTVTIKLNFITKDSREDVDLEPVVETKLLARKIKTQRVYVNPVRKTASVQNPEPEAMPLFDDEFKDAEIKVGEGVANA